MTDSPSAAAFPPSVRGEDDLTFTPAPLARAVGMSRASAYRLRERPGAEGFAAAWDRALSDGRARMFDYAMERAINGVTTITVRRGGSVIVKGGPDTALVNASLRDRPLTR